MKPNGAKTYAKESYYILYMTEKQRHKIERIDSFVGSVLANGGVHEDILKGMYEYMGDFRDLMDGLAKAELDEACKDNLGLLYFAKTLEILAQGLGDGEIKTEQYKF